MKYYDTFSSTHKNYIRRYFNIKEFRHHIIYFKALNRPTPQMHVTFLKPVTESAIFKRALHNFGEYELRTPSYSTHKNHLSKNWCGTTECALFDNAFKGP